MSKEADKTLNYFKTLRSNEWEMDLPPAHYGSYLHNFKNVYSSADDKFWVTLRETTETCLKMEIEKCPPAIICCGGPGTGKTHFEVGLYRAMLDRIGFANGGGVQFDTFSNMMVEMIEGFAEKIPMRSMLTAYTRNKWIFLDDFTASERVFDKTKMEHQVLRDIFINRWDTSQTIITSTNMEASVFMQEMRKLFGDYIESRLSDSVIIQFPDDDLRKKGFGGHKKDKS